MIFQLFLSLHKETRLGCLRAGTGPSPGRGPSSKPKPQPPEPQPRSLRSPKTPVWSPACRASSDSTLSGGLGGLVLGVLLSVRRC